MNRTLTLSAGLLSAAALAAGGLASLPAHAAQGGHYTVVASVNHTEPVLGDRITIRGVVSPPAPGQRVQLEVLYANRSQWKAIGSGTLSGRSAFQLSDKVGSVRVRKYRVVKAAGGGRAAGESKSLTVTVFGWRPLVSLPSANVEGFWLGKPATINGVSYPDSLVSRYSPSASVDYNLNHGCKSLQATFGIDDSSPSNSTANLSVAVDGATKYGFGPYGLTQSQMTVVDLTGAFRVTLKATATNDGRAAVGTPQVLCDF